MMFACSATPLLDWNSATERAVWRFDEPFTSFIIYIHCCPNV